MSASRVGSARSKPVSTPVKSGGTSSAQKTSKSQGSSATKGKTLERARGKAVPDGKEKTTEVRARKAAKAATGRGGRTVEEFAKNASAPRKGTSVAELAKAASKPALSPNSAAFAKSPKKFLEQKPLVVDATVDFKMSNKQGIFEHLGADKNQQHIQCQAKPVYTKLADATLFGDKVKTGRQMVKAEFDAKPGNGHDLKAYYLPWKGGHVATMTLGKDADHFFTAAMSGCTFQVTGPANKPTVSHGNAGTISTGVPDKLAHMNQHLDKLATANKGHPTVRLQKWAATGAEPKGVSVTSYDKLNRDGHPGALAQFQQASPGGNLKVTANTTHNPEHAVVTVAGERAKDGTWKFFEQSWIDATVKQTTTKSGKTVDQKDIKEYMLYSSRQIYPPE